MRTPFLFLLASFAFLILTINFASGDDEESRCEGGESNSAEAKCRKDKAPELCEKNHNKGSSSDSDSDSGEGDSDSDSGSDDDGDGDSDSDSGNSGDSKDDWDSLPDEDKPTGGPTGGPTPNTPVTSRTKKYRHNRYHCDLVDSLRNISLDLNEDQKSRLEFCIRIVEVFMRHSSEGSMVKKTAIAAHKFKQCIKKEQDVCLAISFERIVSWGTVFDLTYVSVDLQADFVDLIISLDDDDDCELFAALRNATNGDSEKSSYVLVLIEELRVILLDVSMSMGQKKAKMHDIFKAFFELHVEWEEFFLEIEIEGFGQLGSFIDVCKGHKQSLTLSVVLSGSSDSDCSLCSALSDAVANTSFTITIRNQIKNFHDKIVNYFATTTDIELRLTYVSQQYWQMIIMEPFIVKIMSLISIKDKSTGEEWGLFYDICWVSQFCKNSGLCGCLSCGMNTTPSPVTTVGTTPSSPATTQPPASSTVPAPDCGSRGGLISVTPQNTTILTDVLTQHYNSWNASMRLGFNTCFNQVRKAIWDNVNFPTVSLKLTEIVRAFNQYGNSGVEKKKVLFAIVIVQWNNGKIGQFCDCEASG